MDDTRNGNDATDVVGEASRESFPASDPPAYTPITGIAGVTTHAADVHDWDAFLPPFREVNIDSLQEGGRIHLALLKARGFLDAVGAGQPASAAGIRACAEGALHAASAHRREFEGSSGQGAEIRAARPWLASRVTQLVHHHRDLESAATALFDSASSPGDADPHRHDHELRRRLDQARHELDLVLTLEYHLANAQFGDQPPALD